MANIELELIWRVMKKIGFKWLRIGSNGGVLWTRYWAYLS